ncbi:hypothetical protein EYV94_23370 [Puteibacter caeruleilacunae]|nr:hypothetical protein EYV94_23370 [Puteibacter caeruleilacunae]
MSHNLIKLANRSVAILVLIVVFIGTSAFVPSNPGKVRGKFVIGGFSMQPSAELTNLSKAELFDFNSVLIDFQADGVAVMEPHFGKLFFGGSRFEYQVSKGVVTLIDGDRKITMPYVYDGVFRLAVNQKNFRVLHMVHPDDGEREKRPKRNGFYSRLLGGLF